MTLLQRRRAEPARTKRESQTTAMPSFSIVVPTYNERDDIVATLLCVQRQTLPVIDVIVVDGCSTDGTRALLEARARAEEITLVAEDARRGVAAARNAGIRQARGDVIVLLNADVSLPDDFLERLAAHYRAGTDALSVDARVENMDAVTGRYIQAMHEEQYGASRVGWSEAFSCRRDAAIAAKFPEEIPGAGGEDVEFLDRIVGSGWRWDVDYSICVGHRVPATLAGFAAQFRGRGRAVPYSELRLRGMRFGIVALRRLAVTMKTAAVMAAVAPHAIAAVRLARRSPRGLADAPKFWLLRHVLFCAHRRGEWESIAAIRRERTSERR